MSKTADPSEIPEVAAFMEAEAKIKNLKEAYPGVFEELEELVEQYNTALESAEKAVRSKEVGCGPFVLRNFTTKYNPQAFYDAVGRDEFLAHGGIEQTVKTYDVDKKLFEAAAAQGKIPKEVVEAVKRVTPSFSVPKKIEIP